METNGNNPHRAHRARVKARFLRGGLDDFSPHEVLELILFYAIPQKDTNVIAHRLLDRFGTLCGVFGATTEELCQVAGISEHAALLLRLWLPAASYALTREKEGRDLCFRTVGTIGDYFVQRYIGVGCETVYLMLLDNRYGLIDCVKVHEGSVNSVSVTPRKLIEHALFRHAAMAVLAHNHPGGVPIPSGEDLHTTASIREAFDMVGVPLLEHILVAGNSYTPILLRSNGLLTNHVDRAAFYADAALLAGTAGR